MQQLIKKMSITEILQGLNMPQQGSNRGYSPEQLVMHFWIGIWCGASCFEHLEVTRQDEVIKQLFGWDRMAWCKAFHRYFNKFNQATNQSVFTGLYQWFFQKFKVR